MDQQAFDPWQYYNNPLPQTFYQSNQSQALVNSLIQYDQQEQQRQGQKVQSQGIIRNVIMSGQLVRFNYAFFKPGHDPQPLVLVAYDDHDNGYLNGINLHYLTMPKASFLMQTYCDTGAFSYQKVSGDGYIAGAYRTYKWGGVTRLQVEPCRFIVQLLKLAQTYRMNVGQISNLVLQMRKMAAEQVVPAAAPSVEQPYNLASTPQQPPQPQ